MYHHLFVTLHNQIINHIEQMLKRLSLIALLMLCVSSTLYAENKDGDPNNNKPRRNVEIKESGLPLLLINTNNQVLYRDTYKLVQVVILNNSNGINYPDTIAHPGQKKNYEGYAQIKYHGHSSFEASDKPPFTIKLCDANGESQKASLLKMGKAKKWILSAPFADRSCIRDKFTYESFRPFFDFVPDMEPVELILDGSYRGIYYITEKIGLNKNRIDADDPTNDGSTDEGTGGYVLKIDRNDETYTANDGKKYNNFYTSKYSVKVSATTSTKIYYNYVEPDMEDMVDKATGAQSYIDDRIAAFEDKLNNNDLSLIDVESFAAYMLATELARNVDGYRLSTYYYKYRDSIDPRFKMTLWDFDRTYGNSNGDSHTDVNTWSYDFLKRHNGLFNKDTYYPPTYWTNLRANTQFMSTAKELWRRMRATTLNEEKIMNRIDSLHNILVSSGAQARNDEAHEIWTRGYIKPITDKQKTFKNITQEIDYMKDYIKRRIAVMDKAFMPDMAGDVNGDFVFDVRDIVLLNSYLNNDNIQINKANADADKNGTINKDDLKIIEEKINKETIISLIK